MIILIEDDECDARLFSDLLSRVSSDKLSTFDTLSAALSTVDDHESHIVFSDLSLPEGRDTAIISQLLAHFKKARIVIVSGHDSRFLETLLSPYPGLGFISKLDLSPQRLEAVM